MRLRNRASSRIHNNASLWRPRWLVGWVVLIQKALSAEAFVLTFILLTVLHFVTTEIGYTQGQKAAVMVLAAVASAFVFSMANQAKEEGIMLPRGADMLDGESIAGTRTSRLTDEEKEEIVEEVFKRIYVEIGRSVVRKAILVIISATFVLLVWLARNHVDIK